MVLRLVDKQNYTSFLPQEMLGIHSVLNCLIPKIYWFAHGSSLFFLSKCPPALLICPGEVNIWGLSKSGQPWIPITALTAYVSTLYHREGSLEDRTEIAQRGFHIYRSIMWKYSPQLPLLSSLTTHIHRDEHCCHWLWPQYRVEAQGQFTCTPPPAPTEEAWHRLEGKRKHMQVQ